MNLLKFEKETYAIRGAVYDVYREIGSGFLEAVYQECLEIELTAQGIPFMAQKELQIFYKGERLQHVYQQDLICYDKIIVELKALSVLTGEHTAQVLNYLKATDMEVALLVNFGSHPKATIQRLVL